MNIALIFFLLGVLLVVKVTAIIVIYLFIYLFVYYLSVCQRFAMLWSFV